MPPGRIALRRRRSFDVREATGSAVLIQLYVVHLRTRPLRRGTRYEIDCAGPLIIQLPALIARLK